MSLTTHLRNSASPLSEHLSRYQPQITAVSGRIAAAVRTSPMLPYGFNESYPYMLAGTAIDYRLRWYFSPRVDMGMVLGFGFEALSRYGKLGQLYDGLVDFLEASPPLRARLSDDDEDLLCRYCIVMAAADHLGRGADAPPDFLLAAQRYGLKRMLASIDNRIVADLVRMSRAFADQNATMIAEFKHARVGGSFEGSSDVQGADVDFLIDGCLYDAKTTKNPTRDLSKHLTQLLAYALLDYGDEYGIRTAGLVFTRQAQTYRVGLQELIGEKTTLDAARSAMVALLRPEGRRKRNRKEEEFFARLEADRSGLPLEVTRDRSR